MILPVTPVFNRSFNDGGEGLGRGACAAESLLVLIVCFLFLASPAQARGGQNSITVAVIRKDFGRMTNSVENNNGDSPASFYEVLNKALKKRKTTIPSVCPPSDLVARRVLEDYGAIFLANKKVLPPPVCIFTSDEEVTRFQEEAGYASEMIGFDQVELQPEAMKQLLKAREEAQK